MAALLQVERPAWPSDARRLARCHSVADLRAVARRRLPLAVFDYLDGAAEDEVTARRNRSAFEEWELVPQVLRDVATVDLRTTVLGEPSSMPVVLAPTGFTGMFHPGGELAVAAAAERAGVPYAVSTLATTSLEDVAARTATPLWFQLYVWRDRGLCRELVARAKAAGYRGLVLTVDTPVPGARERDLRNGLTIPPALTARTVLDGARHPRWWCGLLSGRPLTFANVSSTSHPTAVMEFVARQFDPTVTWDDIGWVAQAWGGPLVLKGVLSADDACRAADAGAAAVVVSNHGGRQLDHAGATLPALERVADAVGDRLELFLDSGVRRGSDVVKALGLGARAVLIGRPYLYGLAAGGQAGVERALAIIADELRRTLALLGTTAARDLDRSVLRRMHDSTHGPTRSGNRP